MAESEVIERTVIETVVDGQQAVAGYMAIAKAGVESMRATAAATGNATAAVQAHAGAVRQSADAWRAQVAAALAAAKGTTQQAQATQVATTAVVASTVATRAHAVANGIANVAMTAAAFAANRLGAAARSLAMTFARGILLGALIAVGQTIIQLISDWTGLSALFSSSKDNADRLAVSLEGLADAFRKVQATQEVTLRTGGALDPLASAKGRLQALQDAAVALTTQQNMQGGAFALNKAQATDLAGAGVYPPLGRFTGQHGPEGRMLFSDRALQALGSMIIQEQRAVAAMEAEAEATKEAAKQAREHATAIEKVQEAFGKLANEREDIGRTADEVQRLNAARKVEADALAAGMGAEAARGERDRYLAEAAINDELVRRNSLLAQELNLRSQVSDFTSGLLTGGVPAGAIGLPASGPAAGARSAVSSAALLNPLLDHQAEVFALITERGLATSATLAHLSRDEAALAVSVQQAQAAEEIRFRLLQQANLNINERIQLVNDMTDAEARQLQALAAEGQISAAQLQELIPLLDRVRDARIEALHTSDGIREIGDSAKYAGAAIEQDLAQALARAALEAQNAGQFFANFGRLVIQTLIQIAAQQAASWIFSLFTASATGAAGGNAAGGSAAATDVGGSFGSGNYNFAMGGVMPGMLMGSTRAYANGGVATEPTMAWFAEKPGMAEAFVPLPDGRRIPVAMEGDGGGQVVNINVTVPVSAIDTRDFETRIREVRRVITEEVADRLAHAGPVLQRTRQLMGRRR